MYASPLYAKYKNFKWSPTRNSDKLPSRNSQFIYGVNVAHTYLLSMFTYMLCFTDLLQNTTVDIIYTNASLNSILTPQPWIQYFQWIVYISMLIQLCLYVCKCGNKDDMLALYRASPFIIIINIFQSISNLLPNSEPYYCILNIFMNIIIISLLIALFLQVKIYDYNDN